MTQLAERPSPSGKMEAMADTLLVEAPAVVKIVRGIFTEAGKLAEAGRGLRYPLASPAADPYTLRIRAGLAGGARATGVAACDAADELTRVGEALFENLELMTGIVRFTELAQIGPVVPCPSGPAQFSTAVRREAEPSDTLTVERWTGRDDDEVMSCAAMLARGDKDLSGDFRATAIDLPEIGAELSRLAMALEIAWPATTASALLQRFAEWVNGSLAQSANKIVFAHSRWVTEYRAAHAAVSGAAERYVSARLDALNGGGEVIVGDVDRVRAALHRYAQAPIVESIMIPIAYPRMKASSPAASST